MFGIDSIYWIFINSVIAFVYLFIISKILGKKQIAQLEFIDYAIGISLGSIAAEMSTDADKPFYYYLIAMTIFMLLAIAVAIIGRKTPFLKRLLKGKPITLIYEGKIQYSALNKSKIDVNDLLSLLREKNFFDVNDVAYAIFEPSGKLSVMPKGNQRPVVIEDVAPNKIETAKLTDILVVDGKVSYSGLNEIGKNTEWLFQQLNIQNQDELKKIILATYDNKNEKVIVHYKNNKV